MAIKVLLVPRALARQARQGIEDVSALAIPGVESRVQQAGRLWARSVVCWLCQQPAALHSSHNGPIVPSSQAV